MKEFRNFGKFGKDAKFSKSMRVGAIVDMRLLDAQKKHINDMPFFLTFV